MPLILDLLITVLNYYVPESLKHSFLTLWSMYLTKAIIMLVTCSLLFWISMMMSIDVRDQCGHVLRDVQMVHLSYDRGYDN